MVNLALKAGREGQSGETGYIHRGDRIPFSENIHFALALFRTRMAENVLEAKEIIEKLLAFEVEGNFPVYLHEFPQVQDPYLPWRILPALFWIRTDFSHVIGELRDKLDRFIEKVLGGSAELPKWAEFRREAFEGKIGSLPETLSDWGEALVSLQIAEKKGAEIKGAVQQAVTLWHPTLSVYVGPCVRRHQKGFYPELTLFDLYLSQWQKNIPPRFEELEPIHLRAALIRPLGWEPEFISHPIPFVHFEREEEAPLFIAWEGHTFILAKKHLEVEGNAEEFTLTFPEELPDSEDRAIEVNFFLNYDPTVSILVQGEKANTFRLGDRVEITPFLSLRFSGEEGKFFGHIMRGNRPSQHSNQEGFDAFDWRIGLRTVSRDKKCSIRVQVLLDRQALENRQPLPSHASHCPHIELPL